MKRILIKLLIASVFLLLLGFVLKNMDGVAVRYFLGFEWQAPLAIVLLVFFGIGIAAGVMASLGVIVRQKREILRLKRELRSHAPGATTPVTAEPA